MYPKNPFEKEENLKPWFELDQKYTLSKKTAKATFIQISNYKPNFFMSFKSTLSHFFAKQAILTGLILLLIITTIGATATEIIAPKEYKPSEIYNKLFATNKQKDKDQYTALAPDNDNYVANLENCDLALKYPKTINNQFGKFWKLNNSSNSSYSVDYSPKDSLNTQNALSISCFNKIDQNYLDTKKYDEQQTLTKTNLNTQELAQKTGWLISQSPITDIILYDFKPINQNAYSSDTLPNIFPKMISFKYAEKLYEVRDSSISSESKFNLFQFQFNSLVKNSFSDDLALTENQQELGTCFDDLNITYKSEVFKSSDESNLRKSIFLSKYEPKKGSGNIADSNQITIFCDSYIGAMGQPYLEFVKFDIAKIPFVSDNFRQTIDPNSVIQRIYKDEKGNIVSAIGGLDIAFNDKNHAYQIYVEKPDVAKLDFDLKIDLKKPSNNQSSSQNTPQTSIAFDNEEFKLMGGGQQRYYEDASGGRDLQRLKDGKIYTIMGALSSSTGLGGLIDSLPAGQNTIKFSGEAKLLDKNNLFGGSGNAEYIITSVEINQANAQNNPTSQPQVSTQPIANSKTYTNKYFPNFKLVYPDTWKFETATKNPEDMVSGQNPYPGLLARDIILLKNNIKINVNLYPYVFQGCGGAGEPGKLASFDNGIKKYDLGGGAFFYATNPLACPQSQQLASNLQSKDYPSYSKEQQENPNATKNGKVNYRFAINVNYLDGNEIKETDPLISEVDQIIGQSKWE